MGKIKYICGQVPELSSWKSKSFTLIELIVAMVIISLIFLLVSSFIWLSFKVSTRSKETALRYAGIRNVFEIITQEIHSAGVFAYPPDEPDFTVNEGKVLSFWCIPPFSIDKGERGIHTPYENLYRAPIFKLTYESKEKDGKDILYKRIQSPFEDKTVELPTPIAISTEINTAHRIKMEIIPSESLTLIYKNTPLQFLSIKKFTLHLHNRR